MVKITSLLGGKKVELPPSPPRTTFRLPTKDDEEEYSKLRAELWTYMSRGNEPPQELLNVHSRWRRNILDHYSWWRTQWTPGDACSFVDGTPSPSPSPDSSGFWSGKASSSARSTPPPPTRQQRLRLTMPRRPQRLHLSPPGAKPQRLHLSPPGSKQRLHLSPPGGKKRLHLNGPGAKSQRLRLRGPGSPHRLSLSSPK